MPEELFNENKGMRPAGLPVPPAGVTGSEINQRILYPCGLREPQPEIPTATEDFPMEKRPAGQAHKRAADLLTPKASEGRDQVHDPSRPELLLEPAHAVHLPCCVPLVARRPL